MKFTTEILDFPGGTVVKNTPTSAGNMGSTHDPGRSHMLWGQQILCAAGPTCPRAHTPRQEKPPR